MKKINELTIDSEACTILSKIFWLDRKNFETAEDLVFCIADYVADHEWVKDNDAARLMGSYYKVFLNNNLEIWAESDNRKMWNSQAAFQVLEAAVYRKLIQSPYTELKELHDQVLRESFLRHCTVSC